MVSIWRLTAKVNNLEVFQREKVNVISEQRFDRLFGTVCVCIEHTSHTDSCGLDVEINEFISIFGCSEDGQTTMSGTMVT